MYNFLHLRRLMWIPAVNQASFLVFVGFTLYVLIGVNFSSSSTNLLWMFVMLLLGSFFSMISDQFIRLKLFLSESIFFRRVSLVVILIGSFLATFRFLMDTKLGRWSLISLMRTPQLKFSSHVWLMNYLSIWKYFLWFSLVLLLLAPN